MYTDTEIRLSAMNFLARREHSKLELRQKISRTFSGVSEQIESVIDQLASENLQSDDRFTESFIRSRDGRFGPVRITSELRQRGICHSVISLHLPDANDEYWDEVAVGVREKKFGESLSLSHGDKAKQIRFLMYRGFTGQQASRTLQSCR